MFAAVIGVVACSVVWVRLDRQGRAGDLPPFEPGMLEPTTQEAPPAAAEPDR